MSIELYVSARTAASPAAQNRPFPVKSAVVAIPTITRPPPPSADVAPPRHDRASERVSEFDAWDFFDELVDEC